MIEPWWNKSYGSLYILKFLGFKTHSILGKNRCFFKQLDKNQQVSIIMGDSELNFRLLCVNKVNLIWFDKVTKIFAGFSSGQSKAIYPLTPFWGHICTKKGQKICHFFERLIITNLKIVECIKAHWYTNGDIVLTNKLIVTIWGTF